MVSLAFFSYFLLIYAENLSMKKSLKLIWILALLNLSGCEADDVHSLVKQSIDQNSIWIFAQINVPEGDGIEDYFYFGRVNKSIFDQMVNGTLDSGFIFFRDVRYFNENDQVVKYEDHVDSGNMVFRIEHIVKIDIEKGDPFILRNQVAEPE